MFKYLYFKTFSYLKFLYLSTNQFGIHSPFIFDLITKCFYSKLNNDEYKRILAYRKSLYLNKNSITVNDFGNGSKVFTSNNRQIAKIAKIAGISKNRSELLFKMVAYFKPKKILEIGSSLGLAAAAMATANKSSKIISLEGCSETAKQCKLQLKKFELTNVTVLNVEFDLYLNSLDAQNTTFDLIYFDGNHSSVATLRYFDKLLVTASNDSVWIFDDIHWSADMEKAWTYIKKHPQVSVTIDTFQWGIVFFRVEQAKQDFTIRI